MLAPIISYFRYHLPVALFINIFGKIQPVENVEMAPKRLNYVQVKMLYDKRAELCHVFVTINSVPS